MPESEPPSLPSLASDPAPLNDEQAATPQDVTDEKSFVPVSANTGAEETVVGSADREVVLAKVETEKRYALIKAWEENEKAIVDNKTHKKLSKIGSWEDTKKASIDARLKKLEEKIERKKAHEAEKINNKMAEIRKAAEERKGIIEAKRGEEFLKLEETAAKYRATGYVPKKYFGCFSS